MSPRRLPRGSQGRHGCGVRYERSTRGARSMQDPAEFRLSVDAALERRLERLGLTGREDTWADRYVLCEHVVDPPSARARQRYEAVARFTRDLIAHRWVKTREARERSNPKRVYYLSMEFLIGRTLN